MKTIDCRNMACPAPVVAVKKELAENLPVVILLDDGAPRENVTRFAVAKGFHVDEQRIGDSWSLTITPTQATSVAEPGTAGFSTTLLITSDRLGDGPEELGRLLMRTMIHTLLEADTLPGRILFLNSGVLLTTEGSPVLEALERLACAGVEIRSCGLCLDYFNLKERLEVGSTTNMLTTVDAILGSERCIKL